MGPERGWSDIAYSFLVDQSGAVFEGRGAGVAGGHTKGRNRVSHAICCMINAESTKPTSAMLHSVAEVAAHGIRNGWWMGWTGGHQDAPGASTACPGGLLMRELPALERLTRSLLSEEDDMPLSDDDLDRIGVRVGKLVDARLAGIRNATVGEKSALKQILDLTRTAAATDARILRLIGDEGDRLANAIAERAASGGCDPEVVADAVRLTLAERLGT